MKGKIIGVIRKCKYKGCKIQFPPLSHNHIYCKTCQSKNKLEMYRAYNKKRELVKVGYKYSHKQKNDGYVTKENLRVSRSGLGK